MELRGHILLAGLKKHMVKVPNSSLLLRFDFKNKTSILKVYSHEETHKYVGVLYRLLAALALVHYIYLG